MEVGLFPAAWREKWETARSRSGGRVTVQASRDRADWALPEEGRHVAGKQTNCTVGCQGSVRSSRARIEKLKSA